MLDQSDPAAVATAGPRPQASTGRVPGTTDSLPTAVDAGLECLRNLALVHGVLEAGNVEHRLRTALSAEGPAAHGRAAARVACAHLAAGDLTDAYFALLTARDQLRETSR
ncbi:hypothetical protein [Actinomycetospora sp. TBRC 11914]|uniref:hypothetical protein n=1 Tax=Actinomycetospora sp. TBRC 11914 TaxID=2729387 RepID=UPI00145D6CB4|nr:hypothetical protein [Actinomycetospora sp. TBRC 11914]NMO93053.1 hypothetical protein [Actinomycetospora sp. TBRC 11914]